AAIDTIKGATMKYRRLGRTGIEVSEIGYGAWGIGGVQWTGGDDEEERRALNLAIDQGLNFIDTALASGDRHSARLVAPVERARRGRVRALARGADLHRHEGSAEKPRMARPRRSSPSGLHLRLHHRVHGAEPAQPRRRNDRPPTTACLER